MNEYQQKFLNHLVKLAHLEKHYAWEAAKRYAEMYPEELAGLPAMLTAEMNRLKAESEEPSLQRVFGLEK